MKREIRICDFCGNRVGEKEKLATLTVPLTKEERKLRARAQGQKPEEATSGDNYVSLSVVFGVVSSAESNAQQFDMCLPCARGLLRLRFETMRLALRREGVPETADV